MKRANHLKNVDLSQPLTEPVHDMTSDRPATASDDATDQASYRRDLWERSVLFLRMPCANAPTTSARMSAPACHRLLDFKYETLLERAPFDTPANYALLSITEIGEDCWDDCVDPAKPPVSWSIRAPGTARDRRVQAAIREVGMALHEGHPVYFVIFFP